MSRNGVSRLVTAAALMMAATAAPPQASAQGSDAGRPLTFTRDVAPILAAKCVACHQEGGIGPFAMKDYATVKGFAPMIREAIRTDRMPPWHPDTTIGKFNHDGSLSDDQIRKIVHWVEAGSPRGEGADPLAATDRTAPEWPLGTPDLVIEIPSYELPAAAK